MSRTTVSSCIPLPDKPLDYKLTAGRYHAKIVRSVYANRVLFFSLELLRGEHAGRLVYSVFNLNTADGKKQFSILCWAVNKLCPKDSSELHGCKLLVTVKPTRIDGVTIPMVVKFAAPLITEVR